MRNYSMNLLQKGIKKALAVAGAVVIGAAGFGIGMGTCTAQADAAVKNSATVVKTPSKIRVVTGQYTNLQGYIIKSITDKDGIKAVSCSVSSAQKKYYKNVATKGKTKYGVPARKVLFRKNGYYTMYIAVRDKKNVRTVKKVTVIAENRYVHAVTGFRNFVVPVGFKDLDAFHKGLKWDKRYVTQIGGFFAGNWNKPGTYIYTYFVSKNGKLVGTKQVKVKMYERPAVNFASKTIHVTEGDTIPLQEKVIESIDGKSVGVKKVSVYLKNASQKQYGTIKSLASDLTVRSGVPALKLRFTKAGTYPVHVKVVDKRGYVVVRGINIIVEPSHKWVKQTETVEHPAEGYEEEYVVKEAWVEEVPVYEKQERLICDETSCAMDLTDLTEEERTSHTDAHAANGGASGVHTEEKDVQTGTEKVEHPAVTDTRWVETKAAWTETIDNGYKCSVCGKTTEKPHEHTWVKRTKTVKHATVYGKKWVETKAAWTEKVVTGYKMKEYAICHDCGKDISKLFGVPAVQVPGEPAPGVVDGKVQDAAGYHMYLHQFHNAFPGECKNPNCPFRADETKDVVYGGFYTTWKKTPVVKLVNHPAEGYYKTYVEKAAWTETVDVGYKCAECGAIK